MQTHSTTFPCACGCGESVSPDHRYRRGHNPKHFPRPGRRQHITADDLTRDFWEHVDRSGECWVWTGSRTKQGYGTFSRQIVTPTGNITIYAHRFSYELHKGLLRKGQVVKHAYDHPWCVNPDHLSAGSQSENTQEKLRKGRAGPHVQLTPERVIKIRESLSDAWAQIEAQAKDNGVKPYTICRIMLRATWEWV